VIAGAFGLVVWRTGSRLALLGIGGLGLVALAIALLHDLPDTHVIGLASHNSVEATTTAKAGLYMETLGAVLLIANSVLAFLLVGLPGVRGGRESRG
jgi:D-arabinose 1-dehydrogenase-like Zn-dependent alcohol dehydrogenase